jgi:hypothetical protein
VGEAFYWLVSRALCLQFHDVFTFYLSPYQFGVLVKGGFEAMVHGIRITLDAHFDWWYFRLTL